MERTMNNFKCGIKIIDKKLNGFNSGDLTVCASRPGHGNLYLILSIVRGIHQTNILQTRSIFFSDIPTRNISEFCEGDEHIFDICTYDKMDFKQFSQTFKDQIAQNQPKIVIIECTEMNFNTNKDYFRLLKRTARENGILIFVKSYLKRAYEQRSWKDQLYIADIESAPIMEKLADRIILLYRPEIYGIRDMSGRDQIGVAYLTIFSYDTAIRDIYLNFDAQKKEFNEEIKNRTYYFL
jgi:replicative DNA helicase